MRVDCTDPKRTIFIWLFRGGGKLQGLGTKITESPFSQGAETAARSPPSLSMLTMVNPPSISVKSRQATESGQACRLECVLCVHAYPDSLANGTAVWVEMRFVFMCAGSGCDGEYYVTEWLIATQMVDDRRAPNSDYWSNTSCIALVC